MARFFFDWNSVVILTKSDLSVTGILKALSEALNCTVLIDGVVDDLFPSSGSYPADALLASLCKLWKCTWKLEAGNLFITPDFSKESQFPDLSLGEIKELTRVIATWLTEKYAVVPGTRLAPEITSIITQVREQVSPAEKEKLETGSGIRLARFSPALQQKIIVLLNTIHVGSAIDGWTKLNTLLESLDKVRFQSAGSSAGTTQLPNGERLRLSFGQPEDSAAVDTLYRRLAANRVPMQSYFKAGSLKAPEAILDHFVLAAPIGDSSRLLKLLAERNRWEGRMGWDNQVLLDTKKMRPSDDILELFPEAYRAYLNAGLRKAAVQAVNSVHMTELLVSGFATEGKLLMGVLQKLLKDRKVLELGMASELERYVVARLMLSQVMRYSLADTINVEKYPERYLADSPNVVMNHNPQTNIWSLTHPSGSSVAFSDPQTSVMMHFVRIK